MKKNVIDGEEVVEMQSDEKGTYHPISIVKISKNRENVLPPMMTNPPRSHKHLMTFYEVLNGFVIGLGAIENFMVNVNKLGGKAK